MRVLCVHTSKGGQGKTATAVTLAAIAAEGGRRTLLVDCDPGGSATYHVGADPSGPGLADVLREKRTLAAVAVSVQDGLNLIGGGPELAYVDAELARRASGWERRLRDVLRAQTYDLVVLDTPPSFSHLTVAALAAADGVLVPVTLDPMSVRALSDLGGTLAAVRREHNRRLHWLGIVPTFVDPRRALTWQMLDLVRQHFGKGMVLPGVPVNVALAEAASFGLPATRYSPSSPAVARYRRVWPLVWQRLNRIGGQ